MASWFETIVEDFNDLPSQTASLLRSIRESDREVRDHFNRIQREEEELLESLKNSIKEGATVDGEAAEQLKSKAAALSAQRQALVASMDKAQLASARSLYEALDDRINLLDANLTAVEAEAEVDASGGSNSRLGDDKLASIESKNAALLKAKSEGTSRGTIALGGGGRGGYGGRGGRGAGPEGMTKKRRSQAASNERMKLQLKAVVGGGGMGQAGDLGDADGGGDSGEPVYCTCRRVSFGQMVACENPDCEVEWFHFACVGLVDEPPDPWFCADCSSKLSAADREKICVQAAEDA